MKQTAVEWLQCELKKIPFINIIEVFKQAKQMEKEQIQKAFLDGQEIPLNHPTIPHYSREEYYNETYK